jgi:hypothetical protein
MECESNCTRRFLDLEISRRDNAVTLGIYHKLMEVGITVQCR